MIRHILLSTFMVLFFNPAWAAEDIAVSKAHAFATAPAQSNGAVFFDVQNNTPSSLKLVAASADVADKVELHTHIMDGDTMMMRAISHYDLPSGEVVMLEPTGHHIMLMGLHEPLEAGSHFELTLSFEQHDPIIVDVMVVAPGVDINDMNHMDHDHSHHME